MKWQGAALADLLTKDIDELILLYADSSKGSIIRAKQRYKKKLGEVMERQGQEPGSEAKKIELGRFEALLERSGIAIEDIAKISRMNVWQTSKKGEEGEWDQIDNYGIQIVPKQTLETFEPIEPANITPTTREVPTRDHRLLLVYGDGQVDYRRIIDPVTGEMKLEPIHDLAAHRVIQMINADLMPETTVNLGDFADMASLSRFAPSSDHFHKTLGPSLRYIHDFYAQMKADNPDSLHVEVDSNHAIRVKKRVLENIPALHDFVRPGEENNYPIMTYYYLANLGKLGLKFMSGYGGAKFVYGQESGNPIIFKHGNHSSSAPGATVRKEATENPTVNVIRGHGHKSESIRKTVEMPSGERRQLFYYQLGSTCLNNGMVEGYASAVDDFNQPVSVNTGHQSTIAIIEDYGGRYNVNEIDVIEGVAYFRGKVYDGNQ